MQRLTFILACIISVSLRAHDPPRCVGWAKMKEIADAQFLVQPAYGYKRDNVAYTFPMGVAIDFTRVQIERAIASKKPISQDQLIQWMDGIAEVRKGVAVDAKMPQAQRYGKHLPRNDEEIDQSLIAKRPNQHAHFPGFWTVIGETSAVGSKLYPRGIEPLYTERSGDLRMQDELTPTGRHSPYLKAVHEESTRRAKKAMEDNPYPHKRVDDKFFIDLAQHIKQTLVKEFVDEHGYEPPLKEETLIKDRSKELAHKELERRKLRYTGFIEIDGKKVPLSFMTVMADSGDPSKPLSATIIHPSPEDQIVLRKEAYRILTELINNPEISEKNARDQMAKAYFILSHATPYENGSPSVVESLFDSIMRAKFGKTIAPYKQEEPFWKAILWDINERPFTGDDLFSCWKTRPPARAVDSSEN